MTTGVDAQVAVPFQVQQIAQPEIPDHFLVVGCNRIFTDAQRGEIEVSLTLQLKSRPELHQAIAAIKWDSIKNTVTCVLAKGTHPKEIRQAILNGMKVCLFQFDKRLTEVPAAD
jgi:hypothetical protein